MQLNRPTSGTCSGTLHDFHWEIIESGSAALISPVGLVDDRVFCTTISPLDGNARAAILSVSTEQIELEPYNFLVASAREKWAAGIEGFGQSGFILSVDGERINLALPAGATSIDIDCVNSDGVVGGSIEVRGEECGAVWREGRIELFPAIRSVTAMNDSGELFGSLHSGGAVRISGMSEYGLTGRVVAVSREGDALVSSSNEISIWKANGGVEAVAIRGYERVSALGWSDTGVILGFGMSSRGHVEHWLFDPRLGLRVLTNQELSAGLRLREVAAIGKNGELAGTAVSGSSRYLVRLY